MADNESKPPVTKYKLTVQAYGNSHEEIESELAYMANGGFMLDTQYYERDEFTVYGGKRTSRLEHTNPDMTPVEYAKQLRAWSRNRRTAPAAEEDQ